MLVQIGQSWSTSAAVPVLQTADKGKVEPFGSELATSGRPATKAAMVYVRPARISDMSRVEDLILPFAARNLMLPRSADQLARAFREFVVAVDENGTIVGCGALRIYNEELAEVCSLAVDDSVQGLGVGRKLVERIVDDARDLGLKTTFALTLNPAFFGRLGFSVVPRNDFPLKVWADCRNCPKLHACDEIAVARSV